MRVVRRKDDLIKFTQKVHSKGFSIGFVPTMGALHDGHLSLLAEAKKKCDFVVCSIFVNPTQFNNSEDLTHYPRTENEDIKKLESANCDLVFIPTVDQMYPETVQTDTYPLGSLEDLLEGAHRPNHFQGVCTIVERLLRLVNPDHAFFGEKDFQQLAIIKKMVSLKALPTRIHGGPTLREPNGLAMSSRNERLTSKQRESARVLYEQMNWIKENITQHSLETLVNTSIQIINDTVDFKVQYLSVADPRTLLPLENIQDSIKAHIFLAVLVNDVRLIDNLSIK